MIVLVKKIGDRQSIRYPLTKHLTCLGRDINSDIFLDGEEVSRLHAAINQEDGVFTVSDSGSTNGTFLNGKKIGEPQVIKVGDEIIVGQHTLKVTEEKEGFYDATAAAEPGAARFLKVGAAEFHPELDGGLDDKTHMVRPDELLKIAQEAAHETPRVPRLVVMSGPLRARTQLLVPPEVTIGRGKSNIVVLDDPQVSLNHAKIVLRHGKFYIYDQRSLNGVLINGKKVRGVNLNHGDEIKLGDSILLFEDPDATSSNAVPPKKTGTAAPATPGSLTRKIWLGGCALALVFVVLYLLWRFQ